MKLLKNIPYLEVPDLVKTGISGAYIWKACHSYRSGKSSYWANIKDPSDGRQILIDPATIPHKSREKYSIPTSEEVAAAIRAEDKTQKQQQKTRATSTLPAHIIIDPQELNEITAALPKYKKIHAYSYSYLCAMCRFYNNLPAQKKKIQKLGFSNKLEIQEELFELAKAEAIPDIPTSFRRFQNRFKWYKENGWRGILHGNINNSHAAKITNEDQRALLRQLYARPNNFSYVKVTEDYNKGAEQMKWPVLSVDAVEKYLSAPEIQQQVAAMRDGMREWRNKYDVIIPRERPSAPGILWVGDGADIELYYQTAFRDKEGKLQRKHWLRLKGYFIIDAFNDLVVGYALSEQGETIDLTKQAWENAILNTGIIPQEAKMDNHGMKGLRPFYEKMARHVRPSAVGNARDKVIEPMFMRFTQEELKEESNWSGCNITAKKSSSHPNREFLMKIKDQFPDLNGVIQQITYHIQNWNNKTRKKTKQSLQEAWQNSINGHQIALTTEKKIELFGTTHQFTNKLTNLGLSPTINGTVRTYNLLDHAFQDRIGDRFQIAYHPDHPELIKATDSKGQSWYVPEFEKGKMALADQQEGDRTKLNERLSFKNERPLVITERNKADMDRIEAMGMLKGFFVDRTGSNKAQITAANASVKQLSNEPDEYDMDEYTAPKAEPDSDHLDEYDL